MFLQKAEYHPNLPPSFPSTNPSSSRSRIRSLRSQDLPSDWVALKLLEGDEMLSSLMKGRMPEEEWKEVGAILYNTRTPSSTSQGPAISGSGEWSAPPSWSRRHRASAFTTRVDHFLTHPVIGTATLILSWGLSFGSPFR